MFLCTFCIYILIFTNTCLQYIMIIFIMGSWFHVLNNINPFYIHLATFMSFLQLESWSVLLFLVSLQAIRF